MFDAKVLLDSVSPQGHRLTTLEVTFPRIVLAEINTHRVFSRNSASSRAIPIEKMIQRVMAAPFIPEYWGKNQKGMQAGEELDAVRQRVAREHWLDARDRAVEQAEYLLSVGVHKQLTNRLLEPFMWQTVIVSATEWSNFYALRCHPDAQPEIRKVAEMMRDAMAASAPEPLMAGEWHLPLLPDREDLAAYSLDDLKRISAGRCARVSYLTHAGKRDPRADIDLCERLVEGGHMSPLEHVATPARDGATRWGNFTGWTQMRAYVPHEDDFGARPARAEV